MQTVPLPRHPIWRVPGHHHLRFVHPVVDGHGVRFHRGGLFPVLDYRHQKVVGSVVIDGDIALFVDSIWTPTERYARERTYVKARIRSPDGAGSRTDFLHILVYDLWPASRRTRRNREPGLELDHVNGHVWDCRSTNLELVPKAENLRRARQRRQKHGFRDRWPTLNPGQNYNRKYRGTRLDPQRVTAATGPRVDRVQALVGAEARLRRELSRAPSDDELARALSTDRQAIGALREQLGRRRLPVWARALRFTAQDVEIELRTAVLLPSLLQKIAAGASGKRIPPSSALYKPTCRLWLTDGESAAGVAYILAARDLAGAASMFGIPVERLSRVLKRRNVRQALLDWRRYKKWPSSRPASSR
jgi:hypothetical protein